MTEKEITDLVRKHSAKPLFGIIFTLSILMFIVGKDTEIIAISVGIFGTSVGACMYIIRKVLIDVFKNKGSSSPISPN